MDSKNVAANVVRPFEGCKREGKAIGTKMDGEYSRYAGGSEEKLLTPISRPRAHFLFHAFDIPHTRVDPIIAPNVDLTTRAVKSSQRRETHQKEEDAPWRNKRRLTQQSLQHFPLPVSERKKPCCVVHLNIRTLLVDDSCVYHRSLWTKLSSALFRSGPPLSLQPPFSHGRPLHVSA